MNNQEVKVEVYGRITTFSTREEARETYLEYIRRADGAERDRYLHIFLQIEDGETFCTDREVGHAIYDNEN